MQNTDIDSTYGTESNTVLGPGVVVQTVTDLYFYSIYKTRILIMVQFFYNIIAAIIITLKWHFRIKTCSWKTKIKQQLMAIVNIDFSIETCVYT